MDTVIEIRKTKRPLQCKLTTEERTAKAHEAAERARKAAELEEESELVKKRARNLKEESEAARARAGELLGIFDTGVETREVEVRFEFDPTAAKGAQVREIRCDTDAVILSRAATGPELEAVRDLSQLSIDAIAEGGKGGRRERKA